MKREHLAHVLRAAVGVTDDGRILVVGSHAILASFDESDLPPEATASVEADLAFFDDEDEEKADRVEGTIGEASPFHQSFGYYGQGVGLSTSVLPLGWEERLVPFEWGDTGGAEAVCLDPNDLVLAKLVAGRQKDLDFAAALLQAGMWTEELCCYELNSFQCPELQSVVSRYSFNDGFPSSQGADGCA